MKDKIPSCSEIYEGSLKKHFSVTSAEGKKLGFLHVFLFYLWAVGDPAGSMEMDVYLNHSKSQLI